MGGGAGEVEGEEEGMNACPYTCISEVALGLDSCNNTAPHSSHERPATAVWHMVAADQEKSKYVSTLLFQFIMKPKNVR